MTLYWCQFLYFKLFKTKTSLPVSTNLQIVRRQCCLRHICDIMELCNASFDKLSSNVEDFPFQVCSFDLSFKFPFQECYSAPVS